MPDTVKSLRAELEAVRAELASLRAWRDSHICQAAPVVQQCTCGTTPACPVHAPPFWHNDAWVSRPDTMGAAGCAGGGYTYTVTTNATAAAPPVTIPLHYNTMGAAPVPQIFTYNVGGECS